MIAQQRLHHAIVLQQFYYLFNCMQNIKLDIIFEDDQFIALNKPAGMLSIPDRKQTEVSLKDMLIEKYGTIFTVHRLDKETSGVIVFAKNAETHKQLSSLFEGREVEKYYEGLVYGSIIPPADTVDVAIMEHPAKNGKMITHKKGKSSITDYEVLEDFRSFSYVKFRIHTGRTHQIRVHMQHIGHTIVCDELYGDPKPILLSALKRKYNLSKKEDEEKPLLARLALHSARLIIELNGEKHTLEVEPPKDIRALLQQLRKLKK